MREILFKAKLKDSEVWVFWNELGKIIEEVSNKWQVFCKDCWVNNVPIQKETISQFTGLNDKNGKKIFEGDIVRYVRTIGEWTGSSDCEVVWVDEDSSFRAYSESEEKLYHLSNKFNERYEVIGNIHEGEEKC